MTLNSIESTVQQTQEWLHALTEAPTIANDRQAWAALRAVLHRLRDRMSADEAVHFGQQLPTLVRGLYYESWQPSRTPTRDRSLEAFLEALQEGLSVHPEIDARQALVRVWALLEESLDRGELTEVLGMLPGELQDLLGRGRTQ